MATERMKFPRSPAASLLPVMFITLVWVLLAAAPIAPSCADAAGERPVPEVATLSAYDSGLKEVSYTVPLLLLPS